MLRGLTCWIGLIWVATVAAAPITPTEPIILFNGKDMSQFATWLVDHHQADPLRVFTVVDAVDGAPAIRVSGEQWGGFVTREEYQNYRLVVEFRWGPASWGQRAQATRDSGILIHCQGRIGNTRADFNGPWMASVETQLIEGGTGDIIVVGGFDEQGNRFSPSVKAHVSKDRDGEWVYDPWGELREFTSGRINWFGRDPDWADRIGFRGKRDVESPDQQWTRVEVLAKDGEIVNWVNGVLVSRVSDSTFRSGKIMIQSEGAEVFFRKIELHPAGN